MLPVLFNDDSDADAEWDDVGDDVDDFPELPSNVGKPGGADFVEFTPAELKVMKRYMQEFRDGNAKARAALLTKICAELYPFQPAAQTDLEWAQRGQVSSSRVQVVSLLIMLSLGHQAMVPCSWPKTNC